MRRPPQKICHQGRGRKKLGDGDRTGYPFSSQGGKRGTARRKKGSGGRVTLLLRHAVEARWEVGLNVEKKQTSFKN